MFDGPYLEFSLWKDLNYWVSFLNHYKIIQVLFGSQVIRLYFLFSGDLFISLNCQIYWLKLFIGVIPHFMTVASLIFFQFFDDFFQNLFVRAILPGEFIRLKKTKT